MTVAFTVAGEAVSAEARDAAIAAMRGTFRAWDVRKALSLQGVQNTDRAADRIMQAARKARRIRAVNNKVWEEVRPDGPPHATS